MHYIMDKIQIFEHFLSEDDLCKCANILNQNTWKWGHVSMSGKGINTPFWQMDLINNEYFSQYLLSKIEKQVGLKFKLNRVYANGQTYGQNGSYHPDDLNPNAVTFCLYLTKINPDTIDDVGGGFQVKLPGEDKYSIVIESMYNRGILFPSHYYHRGIAYSRYSPDLRLSVAWKLEIIS